MRNVSLTAELASSVYPVSGDRIQLQQVIINLIVNSMDAVAGRPEAGRKVVVSTRLADAAQMEVAVADSGTGFDANIGQVFTSFFTTKPQGMGLGLSIASAIIQEHKGQISAENAPEGGAIVRFRLPVAGAAARD